MEHRRDNRNKRKHDKGGRQKGNRDHQQRDLNYARNPQNWKKEQNRQVHREHSKQTTTESANPDLEPVRREQAQIEPQDIQPTRESDDYGEALKLQGEASKLQEPHDERVPDTAVEESAPESSAEQKAEDNITLHIPERHDGEPQIDRAQKEPLSQEQDKLGTPRSDDRKDSVWPSDPEPAASEVAVVPAADVQPKPRSSQYPSRSERAMPRATSVSPVRFDGERQSPIKKSQSDNTLKRRRSEDDYDRDSSPGHARRHMVTESNLRSLERSHRHQSSNSGHGDSARREHHDYYRSRRHRRAGSEDGSRQSRRSSRSSRSSGLDSLEAELLGRPSKGRSDDSMEPQDKEEQERSSKSKRRRQDVDSAYR